MKRIFGIAVTSLGLGIVACSSGAGTEDHGRSASAVQAAAGTTGIYTVGACSAAAPGTAACQVVVVTNAQGVVVPSIAPSGFGPADLTSAYAIPPSGSTATIAIVDAFDNPNAESDLAAYRAQYGLPACTSASGCFTKVGQTGSTTSLPTPDEGWAVEESLDVDMASAACPSCKIILVEANSSDLPDLGASVDTAVSLGATVVSNSYGGGESSDESGYDSHYHHPGVGIFASTGDEGYGVEYPAASPYVTAVGGTTLARASNGRGWTETVWGGAGAGCSQYEPKPSWQLDTGCSNRTVGDVSAVADPATPVAIYDTYGYAGWTTVGGTSVASPLVASIMAATQNGARDPSFSYSLRERRAYNDVTSGSDGSCSPAYLCTGEPGYDGPTGTGTPNASAFARPVNGTGDFNGDGITDILFRNTQSGTVQIWQLNSSGTIASSYPAYTDLGFDWNVQAVGDFNGDGIKDVIFRNSTSGTVQIWQMSSSGTIATSYPAYTNLGFNWQIEGTGDFNGDGVTDVLFRDSTSGTVQIWQMNKTGAIASSYPAYTDLGFDWQIEGTGDFNGSGRDGIIFRNLTTGTVQIWQMNSSGTIASSYAAYTNLGSNWQIDGTGDFNGDGITDVIFRDSSAGTVQIWLLSSSGTITTSYPAYTDLGFGWLIDGTGDFNGDHVTDVVFRNAATETAQIWQLNKSGAIASSYPAYVDLGAAWQIEGLN